MRLLLAILTLLAAAPAHAGDVVEQVAVAHVAVTPTHHVSIVAERDFSGIYATGSIVTEQSVQTFYLDCVRLEPGDGPGEGRIVGSGLMSAGVPIPILTPFSIDLEKGSGLNAARLGTADVRGAAPTCAVTGMPVKTYITAAGAVVIS